MQEGVLDFVFIFGLLGCVLGTYLAGNLYETIPVIHFDTICSLITHSIAGFCSLYIGVSGLATMKRQNLWIPIVTLIFFITIAYGINQIPETKIGNTTIGGYNYMFIQNYENTPFEIVFKIVSGINILYSLSIVLLMIIYILLFDLTYLKLRKIYYNRRDINKEKIE